jgi:hypothetical protein
MIRSVAATPLEKIPLEADVASECVSAITFGFVVLVLRHVFHSLLIHAEIQRG